MHPIRTIQPVRLTLFKVLFHFLSRTRSVRLLNLFTILKPGKNTTRLRVVALRAEPITYCPCRYCYSAIELKWL